MTKKAESKKAEKPRVFNPPIPDPPRPGDAPTPRAVGVSALGGKTTPPPAPPPADPVPVPDGSPTKSVRMSAEIHQRAKVYVAMNNLDLRSLVDELMDKYLKEHGH